MSELIGKTTSENTEYQGVASSTARECSEQTSKNGTQLIKSEMMITVILLWSFLLATLLALPPLPALDDALVVETTAIRV